MNKTCRFFAIALAGTLIASPAAFADSGPASAPVEAPVAPRTLAEAVASSARTPEMRARDRYRHPLKTLQFFGIKPDMTVVEIWPAPGWYSEILVPYLRDHGHYYAAGVALSLPDTNDFFRDLAAQLNTRLVQAAAGKDMVTITEFKPPGLVAIAPAGSADRVLSFRNVHNWMSTGSEQAAFDAFYQALKPGGVLGIVEHRAHPGTTPDETRTSGYVTEAYVKELAAKAGFRFAGESQINDNPKDDTHHPAGVWTLPPTLRLGDQDQAKYLAIGESDRMTLKFVKPSH